MTLALIDASGVRRSWVTEEKSAARAALASASTRAASIARSSSARSSATAICPLTARASARSPSVGGHRSAAGVRDERAVRTASPSRAAARTAATPYRRPTPAGRVAHRDRLPRDDRVDLAPLEGEHVDQRRRQVGHDALRGRVGHERVRDPVHPSRLPLAALGPFPVRGGPRQQRADQRGDHQEHDQRDRVVRARDLERVRRRGEEVVQADEPRDGSDEAADPPAEGDRGRDAQDVDRDRAGRARVDQQRERGRDRGAHDARRPTGTAHRAAPRRFTPGPIDPIMRIAR